MVKTIINHPLNHDCINHSQMFFFIIIIVLTTLLPILESTHALMHQFDGCVSLSTHADVDVFFWLLVMCCLFIMHLQAPIRLIWVYHDWTSKSPSKNARNMCVYVYRYIYIYTWIYQSFYLVINRPGIYHQHFIFGRQPNIPGGEGMGRS